MRPRTGDARLALLALLLAAAAPARAADARGGSWHGWERDLGIEVALDRREVFIGEQVTASVSLLSPVGVASYEGYKPPLYDGFWVEDVETPQRLAWQPRTVNGVPMRAYLIQKLALFPTRAGTLELGPFQLDVAVRVGSAVWPFSDVRRARRQSAPARIQVKPLPPGAPAGFEGVNVGTWKLEASASEPKVVAGQPVTVRITASGDGNVRALALPRLPELRDARRFEPAPSEQVKARGGRLGGSRSVETVVVPERAGDLVVPPLAWPFFDPAAGRYELARTRELRVEVLPGTGVPPPGPAPGAELAAALRPIRTDGALVPPRPPPWTRAPLLAVFVLPPAAFAASVLWDALRRRSRSAAPARRSKDAGRVARRRLRAAECRIQDGDRSVALEEASRALEGFAADRLGRPVAAMTRGDLGAALAEAGARAVAVTALQVALDACDAARFGEGAPAEEVLALAERALALLDSPRRAAARAEAAR